MGAGGHVATLMQLIPDRIGSPLSLNVLKEDVEISYTAVKNAVRAMEMTFFCPRTAAKSPEESRRKGKHIF